MRNEERKKKSIFKQWWFWTIFICIILIIATIVGLVVFYLNDNKSNSRDDNVEVESKSNAELCELSKQINTALGGSNVYYSGDGSLIFIEIRNWKNEYNATKMAELFKILQSDYCKENFELATITTYMESNDKPNQLVIRSVYHIKDGKSIGENESYINFNSVENTINSTENNTNTSNEQGENITLSTGKYIVGEDVKAGKYDVVAKSGSGNFFVHGSTSVNEILSTKSDEIEDYGFIGTYKNLILKNGDEIELRNGLTIELQVK